MKSACIDTHVLCWYLSRPARLGRAAARFLREGERHRARIFVPAIVAVELSLIREAGRPTVGVLELEALLSEQPSFEVLPMDARQARKFALLSTVPDPFDRMILAAARAAGVPLITADTRMHASTLVSVIWD